MVLKGLCCLKKKQQQRMLKLRKISQCLGTKLYSTFWLFGGGGGGGEGALVKLGNFCLCHL